MPASLRPLLPLLALTLMAADVPLKPADYAADAASIENLVNGNYAYLERLPGGRFTLSPSLRNEAAAVKDAGTLVRFSERALTLLADHHAITGGSRKDSWAVFPSFGDMWIEPRGERYVISAVRRDSPAARAGVVAGDELAAIDGRSTSDAVAAFWADLGTSGGGDRNAYAAQVLAAGRRDRPRRFTFIRDGRPRSVDIPNLYSIGREEREPVSTDSAGSSYRIRINDSLGDEETIAAFDAAMASAPPTKRLIIDLTDTPGGGNTVVARAILGWFVQRPTPYQMHRLMAEERRTGIGRQWIEQVLPRAGKYRRERPTVRVGRWTGSMGEGLAIAFASMGARVEGDPMAGLLGAIYDFRLERSGQLIKLPAERLMAIDGTPRERFRPAPQKVDQ